MSVRFRPTADQARTAREKGKEGGRREEKKTAEYNITFLDAVKGLDMARKCVCQLDFVGYFITRCNDPENKLHRELKFKKSKFIDRLNKYTLQIISSSEYHSLVTHNCQLILALFSLKCIWISGVMHKIIL